MSFCQDILPAGIAKELSVLKGLVFMWEQSPVHLSFTGEKSEVSLLLRGTDCARQSGSNCRIVPLWWLSANCFYCLSIRLFLA